MACSSIPRKRAYTYRIANFSLGGPNLRNWIEPPILARIGKGLHLKPLSRMPEGRYAFAAISPSFSRRGCLLPLPSLSHRNGEWAPVGGKIVGQTNTTVLGLALQRTFTFRFRLVP